jgi:hypothetical protein
MYYSESSDGVPAVMKHVLGNMPALYSSMVFLTVRFVAVPTVTDEERFLAWRWVASSAFVEEECNCGHLHSSIRMPRRRLIRSTLFWHSWLLPVLYAGFGDEERKYRPCKVRMRQRQLICTAAPAYDIMCVMACQS